MRRIRLSIILLISMTVMLQACMVNTTSPQISRNIKDSKKNGFFIAELQAESSYDSLIVEMAWVEKIWFNERSGIWYKKDPTDACQLCFKIKQVPGERFMLDNPLRWRMRENATGDFVGIKARNTSKGLTGTYTYEMRSCEIPASIGFDLFSSEEEQFAGSPNDNKSLGTLIFKKK